MSHDPLIRSLYLGFLHREPRTTEAQHWARQLEAGLGPETFAQALLDSAEFGNVRAKVRKLFVPPGHFYSPIVDVDQVRARFASGQAKAAPEAIALDAEAMRGRWRELLPFLRDIPFPEEPTSPWRYHFRNPAFSWGDGSVLHAMLRRHRPRRVVEVGSGYSSACTVDTAERYLDAGVELSFVEPFPALLLKLLGAGAADRYAIHATAVQDTELAVFTRLQAGDFLFIDSTHVMKTGSDVCHELFNVLPALQPGVFVHFHDIFWPFEYGANWVLKENRSWNEIYGLRSFLMYNDAFEIVFFNDWFARHCRELIAADYPAMLNNTGGSIWLRKR